MTGALSVPDVMSSDMGKTISSQSAIALERVWLVLMSPSISIWATTKLVVYNYVLACLV